MKIHVYSLCYNEEIILPFFINHYKNFCEEIIILDNYSTDNSVAIAKDNGCKVIHWNSNNELNDFFNLKVKMDAYKLSRDRVDWVADIKLLHYKLLSRDYVKNRYKMLSKRLGNTNKNLKMGLHYNQSDEEIDRQYNEYYIPNMIKVI